ncbi:ice-binding family protein [Demequina lutea]|uniref:DUF3494 domain-containing protein n=1 Tax=Demequina lutea TaxID=431489 RepID=A0A7Z0CKJ1_9MICO|nr:ice-binding family protein [Demequina lutea]NYI41968.1 hypothetical protein [Demequina lutea]
MFAVGVVSSALVVVGSSAASAAVVPVALGTASSFVVLAATGVTDTGPTTLNGDLGTSPTTSITGVGSITVHGTNHAGDGVTQGAKSDLTAAYLVAAGEGPTSPIAADLAGQTLTAGIYNSAKQILLTGALTLDAAGDPNALFVFQAGSDLIVGPGASVVLKNDAQACNVYWQVGSSATLDTGVSFKGSILALTSITLKTGTTVEGRALAQTGTVTLDTNTITAPVCASVIPAAAAAQTPQGGVSTGDGSTAVGTAINPALPVAGVIAALGLVAVWVRTRRRFLRA